MSCLQHLKQISLICSFFPLTPRKVLEKKARRSPVYGWVLKVSDFDTSQLFGPVSTWRQSPKSSLSSYFISWINIWFLFGVSSSTLPLSDSNLRFHSLDFKIMSWKSVQHFVQHCFKFALQTNWVDLLVCMDDHLVIIDMKCSDCIINSISIWLDQERDWRGLFEGLEFYWLRVIDKI